MSRAFGCSSPLVYYQPPSYLPPAITRPIAINRSYCKQWPTLPLRPFTLEHVSRSTSPSRHFSRSSPPSASGSRHFRLPLSSVSTTLESTDREEAPSLERLDIATALTMFDVFLVMSA